MSPPSSAPAPRRAPRVTARKVGVVVGTLASTWCVAIAWLVLQEAAPPPPPPADAVLVLGAAAYGRKPSPVFEARLLHALDLYRQGVAPRLLFTGGKRKVSDVTEAEVARAWAEQQGVPPGDILCETASTSTLGNLAGAKAVMQRNGLRTACIVSDPLHLARARLLAAQVGLEASTSATPRTRFRTLSTQVPFLVREVYFYTTTLLGLAR